MISVLTCPHCGIPVSWIYPGACRDCAANETALIQPNQREIIVDDRKPPVIVEVHYRVISVPEPSMHYAIRAWQI